MLHYCTKFLQQKFMLVSGKFETWCERRPDSAGGENNLGNTFEKFQKKLASEKWGAL